MFDLVMIPAFGCDHRLYDDIANGLGDLIRSRTLIADENSFAGCARQILAAAPERFVVLGTSFGGRVALEVALAAPKRVVGLVVIGCGPGGVVDPAAGWRRAARLRSEQINDVLVEMGALMSHLPGPRGKLARDQFIAMGRDLGWEKMARQADALAARGDLRPRLGEIHCPALMLWGQYDKFSPAQDGAAMAADIAGARYVEIPDCGHLPTIEAPDESTAALRRWLIDSTLG